MVIVNISSPSCVQQGSMALNCSWPSELTIRIAEAIVMPRNFVQLLFQWGFFSWQRSQQQWPPGQLGRDQHHHPRLLQSSRV
jgi:hypothetical protein